MSSRRRKHGERPATQVHHFATLNRADNAQALAAELKLLAGHAFSRRAWVTLWDLHASHQYLQLPESERDEIYRIAIERGASVLGLDPHEVAIGVAEAPRQRTAGKIDFSFFAAPASDLYARLRPIVEAGFVVEGVCTPAAALWAQSRLRRSAAPGEVHAYVSLTAGMTALAIVSDGFLLYARELSWGFAESPLAPAEVLSRDDLAARLEAELQRSFLYVRQYWKRDVSQLLLCGDMPELRSLTAPLIERLGIEVETLDTLEGLDAAELPEPATVFADSIASLRLATAIAAAPPRMNLLPPKRAPVRVTRAARAAIAAGVAALIAYAAFLHAKSDVREKSVQRTAQVVVARNEPQPVQRVVPTPPRVEPVAPAPKPVPVLPTAAAEPIAAIVPTAEPRRRSAPVRRDDFVEPVVRTILYSPEHRAAVVNGHVVRTGDIVSGATIQSIEEDAILFESNTGRTHRVLLQREGFSATKQ